MSIFLYLGDAKPFKKMEPPARVNPTRMAAAHEERALVELRRECDRTRECSVFEHFDVERRICIYRCISSECYQVRSTYSFL